ncbi:MAG: TonB-dependent receptor [Crocinitomicaceae bacterium]|nr:TonB-dependent receptor [Crocinitomicaceae bacterium]MBT6515433.1 TonB-dependent receptor [Crocinitomicaceae bacterium]
MKHNVLVVLLIVFVLPVFAQNKYTLSGYVKDAKTGELLIGAEVYIKELMKGQSTNNYGFYSITVPEGKYTLVSQYFGFDDFNQSIQLNRDQRINIELGFYLDTLGEVVVESERKDQNTTGTQMGTIELDMTKIKTLPAFMGEVDILKTIQLLPGVQSGGEGNTGFYVRGGGPDQNLILLDEATVYNASHLFGFFSVFNADAIKKVNLIKGGMPANYGGRLSSVLDITMNDGNYKEYHANGGIGVIASRLTVEGPIKKDTASFIVSGRRTYIDVLTKPFVNDSASAAGSGYYFYDLTAKANWRISDKDRLFLSGYFGRDVFTFNNDNLGLNFRVPWGNATASLRWNHLFNDRLFLNTTAIFSDYKFAFEAEQSQFKFKLSSGIRDYNLKTDFTWFAGSNHKVKFGVNYIYHTFTPSSFSGSSGDQEFGTEEITRIKANEGAIYILDEFEIGERIKINAGARLSAFQHIGPFTRYYKNETSQLTDSTRTWGKGESIIVYPGFEPRFSARYLFADQSSFKLGFTHNYQYVHLASISAISLPTDLWFPSSELVKPQIGTQYSIGYFKNFKENTFETSVELYYKKLRNLIEYKQNAQPEDNVADNVDNQLTFGDGYSYGAEFFLKKKMGDWTGWIGYTWSRTMRQFDAIDQGNEFSAKYDRRHDLSVVLSYDISKRVNVGAAFVYASGNTITLPYSRYFDFTESALVTVWGPRNGDRMPAYHRADISCTIKGKHEKKYIDAETGETKMKPKRIKSNWNISVYNLYNRANPYFIYFDNEGDLNSGTLDLGAYQVSLFPILPSVTWNFEF